MDSVGVGAGSHIPVEPIGDVKCPIRAERKDIMAGDGLCLSGPLEHKQLGQDGDALQKDAKAPHDLDKGGALPIMEEDAQHKRRADEVL